MLFQFVLGTPVVRLRAVVVAFEHSDLIIEFTAPQRVLDEMQVRPNPLPHGVHPCELNYLFHWDRSTVGYKPAANWLTIINHAFAYNGPESISPNQGVAF